jgi:hypothetical protein
LSVVSVVCLLLTCEWGILWRSWLRHCATSRKVTGPIPDGVNVCGFHIVVLVLLYDEGVIIPSNTTMFDFILLSTPATCFGLLSGHHQAFRSYYTTVHILITTTYG